MAETINKEKSEKVKLADIIIPHHNRHDHLNNLLGILDNSMFNIIVVAGGSFAENCNKGAQLAETNKIIFINDDALPSKEALIKMCNSLESFDMVGSTQITKDNIKYYGIGLENIDNFITHRIRVKPGDSVLPSAFCFAINKDKWVKLGGFDENYKTGNEDVDLGLRAIDEGLKIIILDLEIPHAESQSDGRFSFVKENNSLFEKMYSQKYLKNKLNNMIDINEINFKKLRIAITCITMSSLSGSPLYHYTLAKELAIQGHHVDFYSGWGTYFTDLDNYGVSRLNPDQAKGDYDLLLMSQDATAPILERVNANRVFNIIHSEYDCETPIISSKINHYIAIRPEIKEHLITEHNISEDKITVIYNGVDFNRFDRKKRKKHKGNYTKVVLPCTLDSLRLPFIEHYTKKANKDFRVVLIGQDFNHKIYKNEFVEIHKEVEDIENYIFDADFIAGILLGRVNLEARAMGITSYIHNPAKPEEVKKFHLSNKEFDKRHNIVNVAKDIISTYISDLCGNNIETKENINQLKVIENKGFIDEQIKSVFNDIFESNKWGKEKGVSVSGSGSTLEQTEVLRKELPKLFEKFNIKSILDIPCGDFYWLSKLDLKGIDYTGADIVTPIIDELKTKHSNHKFLNLDICNSNLPKADLAIVRDCFVHFPYNEIHKAIENIKRSGTKYLLTTSFTRRFVNIDIEMGQWRPINLQVSPFNLSTPIYIINEQCTEGDGHYKDKSMILIDLTK